MDSQQTHFQRKHWKRITKTTPDIEHNQPEPFWHYKRFKAIYAWRLWNINLQYEFINESLIKIGSKVCFYHGTLATNYL